MLNVMRDFQTWLITQVMVTRGAACQVISELTLCSDCTVYTSQAAEQGNKTHLTWPKTSWPVFTGVIILSWGHAFLKDRENVKFGLENSHLSAKKPSDSGVVYCASGVWTLCQPMVILQVTGKLMPAVS